MTQYSSKDIFNENETAVLYRMQSGRSFLGSEEKPVGGKVEKARVTLLVGCSAEGEFLPLLCIGKAKKPRWPAVLGRKQSAPISYDSSSKGWMTERIWKTGLIGLNRRMREIGLKILFIVDNCPSHKMVLLNHTALELLPLNTTSKLHPCDQGIIRSLKVKYRACLERLLLSKDDSKVSLYDPLMIRPSWNDVTPETVKNCWRKSGLVGVPDNTDDMY